MLYLIRTLKEYEGNRVNTDFVLEAENDSIVKDFFNHNKLIILWISQVQGRPSSAQYYGIFQINEQLTSKFCLKAESVEAAVQRCIDLSLPIIHIDNISKPLSDDESNALITRLSDQKQAIITKKKEDENEEKRKEYKIMDNRKKEKIMKVIEETLNDIKNIETVNEKNTEIINEKRKLNELKEQLTKIKMWSNIEKATSILEQTFGLMEQIEMKTIYKLKEQEEKIDAWSVISNVDIISELEKIKRAQQATKAGTKQRKSDLYYTYLWILGLYQKFIAKEALNKVSHFKSLYKSIIPYLGFSIDSATLWMGILFAYYAINDTLHYNILLGMIALWLFSLIRNILFLKKNRSLIIDLIYIILAIILTIIIYKSMIIFFALV